MTRAATVAVLMLLLCPPAVTVGQPATAPAASTAPTVAPGLDASTPKGAVKLLQQAMAAGDAAGVRERLVVSTPDEQRMADAMSAVASAVASLRRAAVDQFGKEAVVQLLPDPSTDAGAVIDAARETTNPDGSVTIVLDGAAAEPMTLRQTDGQWRVLIPQAATGTPKEELDTILAGVAGQVKVYESMAEEITAGKYRSMDEVATVLHGKLMQAARPAAAEVPEDLKHAAP